MIKNLVSHGNSMALIIDKPLLEVLKIKASDSLEIATDGRNIIISPVGHEKKYRKFQHVLNNASKRHAESLRLLAG